MKRFLSLLLVVVVATTLAFADEWKMDKAHTSVLFTVKHMVISEVTGKFNDFDLKFSATKEDFSDAAFEGTIKTASISTDNDFRDKHLRSDDFFNADSFPTIKFKSTSVERVGDDKYKVTGNLTIRDVTKAVTWDATMGGVLKTSRGTVAAWKATLTINRFDYKLKYDRVVETGGLVVGKDVVITIASEFQK